MCVCVCINIYIYIYKNMCTYTYEYMYMCVYIISCRDPLQHSLFCNKFRRHGVTGYGFQARFSGVRVKRFVVCCLVYRAVIQESEMLEDCLEYSTTQYLEC